MSKFNQKQNNFSKKPKLNPKNLDRRIKTIEREIELKHVDAWYPASSLSATTPRLYLINPTVQGLDSDSNRIGDEIRCTSAQVRFDLAPSPTPELGDLTHYKTIRMILFWDRQANGVGPTIAGSENSQSLLDTTNIIDTTLCPFNHNNNQRYKVLKEKIIKMWPTAIVQGGTPTFFYNAHYQKIHQKLNRITKFNSQNTAGIADINANALYMVLLTSADSGAPIVADVGTRCYFKDA